MFACFCAFRVVLPTKCPPNLRHATLGASGSFLIFAHASATRYSQPWIDGLAFHCENAEHTFVHTIQRLALSESMKGFEAQRKLT